MSRPTPDPIDPARLADLALSAMKAAKFPQPMPAAKKKKGKE